MKKRLSRSTSIQVKLLLSFIIVITVCTIIFASVSYMRFSKTIALENQNSISQVLTLSEKNMRANISHVENLLISVQANSQIENILTSSAPHSYLEEIDLIDSQIKKTDILRSSISDIYFYAANRPSYPIISGGRVFPTDYVKNEMWYKSTLQKGGETCITVIDSSPTDGVICVSRPFINTSTHEILGIIRIDINLAAFMNDISKITVGQTGKVFLVFGNHIINPWSNSYINSFVNEKDFFDRINNASGIPAYINTGGEKQIIASAPLYSDSLKIVCAAKYSEINNSAKLVSQSTWLTAIVTLIIAIIIMGFISEWITHPIKRLTSYMERFGTERVTIPPELETNDEIGRLCSTYNHMLSTIDSLIDDVKTLYKKQKIYELKALQAQINPHFLYNTLDSINWMAKKHGARDISKMVTSLGSFFRHSLNKGSEFTTLENELKQIKSYAEIQTVRFENKFRIIYNIDEELLGCRVLKLMIQPLVENSIAHGFEELEDNGIIHISIGSDGKYIYITVDDNGCGCDTDKLNREINSGFNMDEPIEKYGLNNVNQRIKLYFDSSCGLHFETNSQGGVCAVIKVLRRENDAEAIDM